MIPRITQYLVAFLFLWAASPSFSQDTVDFEFFESHVRPLLSKHCFECHRRKAEAGLRLDSKDFMLKGGKSGPAVVPGDSKNSILWQVVSGKHDELTMPPDNPLDSAQIDILAKWIDQGAKWPAPLPGNKSIPDSSTITDEEREFWSFQPLRLPTIPRADGKIGDNPVDAFVSDARLKRKLTPTRSLKPHSLIRRIYYDLIGLPPSPDKVAEFESAWVTDPDKAVAELVEQLLDSKQYGERWAQHWLDLVRYADTAGDAADFPVPEAYKYRNYIIDAFNNDMPYDQFVREQISGDLMRGADPEEAWRRTIATGYIAISRRIGVTPETLAHITIEDTIDNLGKTFLGLSIGCARCHDHKFDPISTADYYALYGIFQSTNYPHAGSEHKPYRLNFVYRIGSEAAENILSPERKRLEPMLKKERAAFERYRDFQRKPINKPGYNRDVAWQEVLDLRSEIGEFAKSFPEIETAYAASEGKCSDAYIQNQGDPRNRGARVPRGFLQILGGETVPEGFAQSGRLQLADWIANNNNPLTARVMANRVWHHHFGRGLVATPSDFGVRGAIPSHPELLDFLAQYLIDQRWSIKQLHRLIVNSQTYRLDSSESPGSANAYAKSENEVNDPENIFLWRGNRRRMDAEQLRDSILTIAGKLDCNSGGRHPMPHHLTYFYRQHEPFLAHFETNQRSIYQFRQRIQKNNFLDTFDAPDGNLHIGDRRDTITSIQALYLLNSEFIDHQSHAIATRMLASNAISDGIDRVEWIYQHLLGRRPSHDEARTVLKTARTFEHLFSSTPSSTEENRSASSSAWSSVIRSMLCSNAFLYVE